MTKIKETKEKKERRKKARKYRQELMAIRAYWGEAFERETIGEFEKLVTKFIHERKIKLKGRGFTDFDDGDLEHALLELTRNKQNKMLEKFS